MKRSWYNFNKTFCDVAPLLKPMLYTRLNHCLIFEAGDSTILLNWDVIVEYKKMQNLFETCSCIIDVSKPAELIDVSKPAELIDVSKPAELIDVSKPA